MHRLSPGSRSMSKASLQSMINESFAQVLTRMHSKASMSDVLHGSAS